MSDFRVEQPLVNGGLGAVTSVSNSDGTLTVSPTIGPVVASINLAKSNTWTNKQTMVSLDDSTQAVVAKGYSNSQSANILEAQGPDGTVYMRVGPSGQLLTGPILNTALAAYLIRTAATKVASVTFKQLTSNVVTLTTASAHNFFVGETVSVSIGDGIYNGSYSISGIPSTTTFTYSKSFSNQALTAASGTATCTANASAFEVQDSTGATTIMSLTSAGQLSIRNNASVWVQLGTAGNAFIEMGQTDPRIRMYYGQQMGWAVSGSTTVSVSVNCEAAGVLRVGNASTGAGTLSIRSTTTIFTQLNSDGSAVFNENGADADFRVEGDTDQNLLFADASVDRIGIGTSTPLFKLDARGTVSVQGMLKPSSSTKTGDYNVTVNDHLIPCDATSAGFNVNLPALSSAYSSTTGTGLELCIIKIDATGNVVTIDGSGSETINGQTAQTLDAQWESIIIQAASGGWYIKSVS